MDPLLRFADAVAWFDAEGVRGDELVAAAADLVAAGCDDDAVLALACLPPARDVSTFELDAAVDGARESLGLRRLDDAPRTIRAAQTLARRWLAGSVGDQQLTGWASDHCDWDEEGPLSPLLRMDHELHSREVTGRTLAEVRAMLRIEVKRLLAQPDPWAPGPSAARRESGRDS